MTTEATRGAAERTFLSEANVLVTNARLVIGGQTHAMSGVTSVKTLTQSPNSSFAVICLLLGIVLMSIGFSGTSVMVGIWGVAAFALGILVLKSQKPTHHLVLTSSSGEVKAISSANVEFINRILQAVNNAIISRS